MDKPIEAEVVPYIPVHQVVNGNRRAKLRARFFKTLKRKAVTAIKRANGRRLTDAEMRAAKGYAVEWMASQLAVV
jgi:hypothetical protein